MSQASRLRAADTRIVRQLPPRDPATGHFLKRPDPSTLGPQLGKNYSQIPGGLWYELHSPITVAGIRWAPADGDPFASPIGAALAAELAS